MKESRVNGWDMLSLPLWAVLFVCGLVPDVAFVALRQLANVSSHSAMINSSSAITFALSGYLAIFVLRRCRESGATEAQARSRAMVAGMMGLVAFVELPGRGTSPFEPRTFLEVWVQFRSISDSYVRNVIVVFGAAKLLCWWMLLGMLMRFHAFGNRAVFNRLPTLFWTGERIPREPTPDSDDTTDATAQSAK